MHNRLDLNRTISEELSRAYASAVNQPEADAKKAYDMFRTRIQVLKESFKHENALSDERFGDLARELDDAVCDFWKDAIQRDHMPRDPDLYKCGSEINQLLNQQFTLGTTGVILFAGYAGYIIPHLLDPAKTGIDPLKASNLLFWSTIFMTAIFTLFFFWSMHLRDNLVTISTWLQHRAGSVWECEIRHFSGDTPVGQTRFASTLLLAMGTMTTFLYFLGIYVIGSSSGVFAVFKACVVVVCCLVSNGVILDRGILHHYELGDKVVKKWNDRVWNRKRAEQTI